MPIVGLALVVVWILLVAGVRGYLQYRRTGEPAIRFTDRRGSPQWWSRVISSVGLVLAIAAPLADLVGLPRIAAVDGPFFFAIGLVLYAAGIAITIRSQAAMGASWRADVDPAARTELVTTGPFRIVRNPTLAGAGITAVGLLLIVPNLVAVAMLLAFLLAMNIQVRLVEEPYLLRVHGEEYRRYAARTGRFVPGLGRLRDGS